MRTPAAALALVFAAALFARIPGIGERSLWLDETATTAAALAPDLSALVERVSTAEVGKGPLYYLLLRAWCGLLGDSETALRLPSALAGAAAAVAAGLWASWLFRAGGGRGSGAAAAALAGLAVALHPVAIALSREARSYAFSHAFLFFAAAGTVPAYFAGARTSARSRAAWRILVPLLAALGVSSHLFSAFFAAGLLAAALVGCAVRGSPVRPVLLGAAAAGLLLALQIPMTLRQISAHYAGAVDPVIGLRDMGHYAKELLAGTPAAFVLVPLLALAAWRRGRDELVRTGLLVAIVSALAVLAVQFLVKSVIVGGSRYLAWEIAPLAAVLSAGATGRKAPAVTFFLLASAALLAGAWTGREYERRYSEDWRAVARALVAEARGGDVVACHAAYVDRPLQRYFSGAVPLVAPPEGGLRAVVARAASERAPGGRVFLVLSHAAPLSEADRRAAEAALGPAVEIHSQFAIRVLRFGP